MTIQNDTSNMNDTTIQNITLENMNNTIVTTTSIDYCQNTIEILGNSKSKKDLVYTHYLNNYSPSFVPTINTVKDNKFPTQNICNYWRILINKKHSNNIISLPFIQYLLKKSTDLDIHDKEIELVLQEYCIATAKKYKARIGFKFKHKQIDICWEDYIRLSHSIKSNEISHTYSWYITSGFQVGTALKLGTIKLGTVKF